jgi:chemotaxis methyl-accepting protein methylase
LPFNRAEDRFDVIFLRNVMLYFSHETRKTLLAGIHRVLAPDGILFLGSSEQPADPSIWTAVLAGGTCYFRPKSMETAHPPIGAPAKLESGGGASWRRATCP